MMAKPETVKTGLKLELESAHEKIADLLEEISNLRMENARIKKDFGEAHEGLIAVKASDLAREDNSKTVTWRVGRKILRQSLERNFDKIPNEWQTVEVKVICL